MIGIKPHQTKEAYISSDLTKRLSPERITFSQPRQIAQNDFLRRVIKVKNFPGDVSKFCLLSSLSQFKNTTFSLRAVPLSEGKAAQLINAQINNNVSVLFRSKKATKQIDADRDTQNLKNFYIGTLENKNLIYYVDIFIEFYGRTIAELNQMETKIKNALLANRITYEVLAFQQKQGFTSVFPLTRDTFLKTANNFPTNTLACLYPFSFSTINHENGLFLGETVDHGYVFLDFDLRTSAIVTGNFAIIGKTGEGKTRLMKKIISQELFKGTTIFIFDPDMDYVEMTEALSGTNIDCADGQVKINPLEARRLNAPGSLDAKSERELSKGECVAAFKEAKVYYQHLSWLREFFGILFPEITSAQLDTLMIMAEGMYQDFGINPETNFDRLSSEDYPVLSDLYMYTEKVFDGFDGAYKSVYKMLTPALLRDVLRILYQAYKGDLSFLLNGHTNIQNDKFINFNMKNLITGSNSRTQAIIFNILTYTWNRISQRGESCLLVIDELHHFLNKDNPIIVNYLRDFMKRIRKYGSKMGTATQNLDDYDDPAIRHLTQPLFSNTDFKFLFHPGISELRQIQELLRLTDGEATCISRPNQRHCLLKAGNERCYFKVGDLPYEEELFGTLSGK